MHGNKKVRTTEHRKLTVTDLVSGTDCKVLYLLYIQVRDSKRTSTRHGSSEKSHYDKKLLKFAKLLSASDGVDSLGTLSYCRKRSVI